MSPERIPELEARLAEAEKRLKRERWRDYALICLGVWFVILVAGFGVYVLSQRSITGQVSDSVNRIVCPAVRGIKAQVERSKIAAADEQRTDAERAVARKAVADGERWWKSLRPIPPKYRCDKLLRKIEAEYRADQKTKAKGG